MDKGQLGYIIALGIFTWFIILLGFSLVYAVWFAVPGTAWYIRLIFSLVGGFALFMGGKSLWLNFLRPLIYRIKNHQKLF